MAESIHKRLDRVLDHVDELGAKASQILLSRDDLKELKGPEPKDGPGVQATYRDVPVKQGEIGQSSYVESKDGPNGSTNFGV